MGAVERRAKQTTTLMLGMAAQDDDEAENTNAGDRRRRMNKQLAKWAIKSESHRGIRAMIELAKSELGIAVRVDELDCDLLRFVIDCEARRRGLHRRLRYEESSSARLPRPPADVVEELVNAGRRVCAARHHPERGGASD